MINLSSAENAHRVVKFFKIMMNSSKLHDEKLTSKIYTCMSINP